MKTFNSARVAKIRLNRALHKVENRYGPSWFKVQQTRLHSLLAHANKKYHLALRFTRIHTMNPKFILRGKISKRTVFCFASDTGKGWDKTQDMFVIVHVYPNAHFTYNYLHKTAAEAIEGIQGMCAPNDSVIHIANSIQGERRHTYQWEVMTRATWKACRADKGNTPIWIHPTTVIS